MVIQNILVSFCLRDSSTADLGHYHRREWPVRSELTPGTHNVLKNALVQTERILLSLLYIKPELMKKPSNALSPQTEAFKHIRLMFPNLSKAKVRGGSFIRPQVGQILESEEFEKNIQVSFSTGSK